MSRVDRTNAVHHLYRCYDATGRLIYVGSTAHLAGRLDNHRRTTWWAPQVARVVAKVYPNGVAARIAERAVIRNENPRWNIQGRWTTVRTLGTLADLQDYRRAIVAIGFPDLPSTARHLASVDKRIAELEAAS